MKTISITKEVALNIFTYLNEPGKKIFKEIYYDFFSESLYEIACKKLELNFQKEIPYLVEKTERHKKTNAFAKLSIIREAHGNHPGIGERKWYPVFTLTKAGLVFSAAIYEFWNSYSGAIVGSPFVFKTEKEAIDFGKDNLELYNVVYK